MWGPEDLKQTDLAITLYYDPVDHLQIKRLTNDLAKLVAIGLLNCNGPSKSCSYGLRGHVASAFSSKVPPNSYSTMEKCLNLLYLFIYFFAFVAVVHAAAHS